MTPKEKANEIFNDMFINQNNGTLKEDNRKAKQCALVAVDEIINCDSFTMYWSFSKEFTKYWNEVKQEIEKL